MLFISLIIIPVAYLTQKLWPKAKIDTNKFFGMSVNFDKAPDDTLAFVQELGITQLLIRFRMDQLEILDDFITWIKKFKEQEITINLIQDPNLKHDELFQTFNTIFTALFPYVKRYQIGTTINRSKWGFYSVNEYLKFFRQAHKLRKNFQDIELLGPSVIDFEYHYTTQALFNISPLRFDACSSLLYVDRTVTPENKQFGFNLLSKINLLYSLVRLSPKTKNKIYITETNWPIKGSGDYAPTSDLECVSEEDFANYMVRYYLLALGSSKVTSVFWHQLIAVGFGLINPRKNLEKRAAFDAFKTMLKALQGAKDIKLVKHKKHYELSYRNLSHEGKILWTNDETVEYKEHQLSGTPLYLITKEFT
jgi:hypothetical protein